MRSLFVILCVFALSSEGYARSGGSKFSVSPYFSMKTKTVKKKDRNDPTKEVSKTRTRTEYGVKGSLRFMSIMKLSLGIGQNSMKKTEQVSELKDEYGEVDFNEDLGTSSRAPTDEVTMTETQRLGKLTLSINPKMGPLIFKAGAGVTAKMRIIESEINGVKQPTIEKGPNYKPHSVVGVGMKLNSKTSIMLEYELYHYKFPELEPFERAVTLSAGVGI